MPSVINDILPSSNTSESIKKEGINCSSLVQHWVQTGYGPSPTKVKFKKNSVSTHLDKMAEGTFYPKEVTHITKFNGTNFRLLKFQLNLVLEGLKLLEILDGTTKRPELKNLKVSSEKEDNVV